LQNIEVSSATEHAKAAIQKDIDRLQFLCWHYSSSHLGSGNFMKMIDDV
jgi:hypothetical protein